MMIGLFVQVADVINGGGKNCMQTKKAYIYKLKISCKRHDNIIRVRSTSVVFFTCVEL